MTEDRIRKNDEAWVRVCDQTELLREVESKGYFIISAKELQRLSGERQPRLMAKLDSDAQRPKIFKKNRLNILPLKRGDYVIFRDPDNICFKKLPPTYNPEKPTPYKPKVNLRELDTLRMGNRCTESDAIEIAIISSLLSTFCGTKDLRQTRRGRFGSGMFQIKLPGSGEKILVESSQIEVDSICESKDVVVLVEAKIGFHDDFNIRQLFYPYLWLSGLTKKSIVAIFLCYSNDVFQLNEYAIGTEFGDIDLLRQEYFILDEYVLARGDLSVIVRGRPSPIEDYGTPFPQADDMDKVVDLVQLAGRGIVEAPLLVEIFGFEPRQALYYRAAARYLGLIGKDGKLSKTGSRLLSLRYRLERTEMILNRMLDRPALREAILTMQARNFDVTSITLEELEVVIEKYRPAEYSDDTLGRRAQTVKNWLKWLVANCDFNRLS